MGIGYIKLHRQIQDCWLWTAERFSMGQAWIDLLLMVNHADRKTMYEGKLIVVSRGQFITSIQKLSVRWKWNRKSVMKFLDILESDGMITQTRTTHGTTITIVNWDSFQVEGTTKRTTDGQQYGQPRDSGMDTNNNDKEYIKNDKNNKKHYVDDEKLNQAIIDFINHRKKIKSSMTDRAIELFLNRLNKLSDDPAEQIRLIETAIERGWKSVYPSKDAPLPPSEPEKASSDKLQELENYWFNRTREAMK